jgi:hypothetical protein
MHSAGMDSMSIHDVSVHVMGMYNVIKRREDAWRYVRSIDMHDFYVPD